MPLIFPFEMVMTNKGRTTRILCGEPGHDISISAETKSYSNQDTSIEAAGSSTATLTNKLMKCAIANVKDK